jgi:hypothetical protein
MLEIKAGDEKDFEKLKDKHRLFLFHHIQFLTLSSI